MPDPYYSDDWVTIYHGDCREVLPGVGADLLVSDPPYGMGWENNQRFSGGNTRRGDGTKHPPIVGDDEPFDPTPFLGYRGVVLWGANHFWDKLPPGAALVWQKRRDWALGTFLSDAEIAFLSRGHGVYAFTHMFSGSKRALDAGYDPYAGSAHPNQKPVELMRWSIEKAGEGSVLDPFLGSGTTLVAAKNLGRKAIGIEIEERYCEIAAERCSQGVLELA